MKNLCSVLSGCLLICSITIGCRPESPPEPTIAPELTPTVQEQEAVEPTPTRSAEPPQPTASPDLTPTVEGSETPEVTGTPTATSHLRPTRLTHVAPYVLEINPQLPLYTLVFRALPCDPSAVVARCGWVDVYREGALVQTLSLESDRGIVNCCDGGDCPMGELLARYTTAADINFDGYLDFGYNDPGGLTGARSTGGCSMKRLGYSTPTRSLKSWRKSILALIKFSPRLESSASGSRLRPMGGRGSTG
jgi:hypothetical protein